MLDVGRFHLRPGSLYQQCRSEVQSVGECMSSMPEAQQNGNQKLLMTDNIKGRKA